MITYSSDQLRKENDSKFEELKNECKQTLHDQKQE